MGYSLSTFYLSTAFVFALLTFVLQVLICFKVGELSLERPLIRRMRWLYGSLALISAALIFELTLALVAVEGGVYFSLPLLQRYLALLAPLISAYTIFKGPSLWPEFCRQCLISGFVPLLFLPLWPSFGTVAVTVNLLALLWLGFDAASMFKTLITDKRWQAGSTFIPQVIHDLENGLCILDIDGRVLEMNPAFYMFSARYGFTEFAQLEEFEQQLSDMVGRGLVMVTPLGEGRLLRFSEAAYLLNEKSFTVGNKAYEEFSVTDVTAFVQATLALERENAAIAQENLRLEKAMVRVAEEAALLEQEKLSRRVHDVWSQRLAIAGLSLDTMLEHGDGDNGTVPGMAKLLSTMEEPDSEDNDRVPDLFTALEDLVNMYQRLGVQATVEGRADFNEEQEQVLVPVIREALANAVRHAYATAIKLLFFATATGRGVAIRNACLEHDRLVRERRGLYDIRQRVQAIGGEVEITKDESFILTIIFPADSGA